MTPLGLVAALALVAVQAAPALVAPDAIAKDPDAAAAGLAGFSFVTGCIERAGVATSAADYANGSTELGHSVKAQSAQIAALPFSVEGVDGDTCRVTYQGAHTEMLWKAFTDFRINKMNGTCVEAAPAPYIATLSCAANKGNPAYEQRVERRGDRIVLSLRWRGPATP